MKCWLEMKKAPEKQYFLENEQGILSHCTVIFGTKNETEISYNLQMPMF